MIIPNVFVGLQNSGSQPFWNLGTPSNIWRHTGWETLLQKLVIANFCNLAFEYISHNEVGEIHHRLDVLVERWAKGKSSTWCSSQWTEIQLSSFQRWSRCMLRGKPSKSSCHTWHRPKRSFEFPISSPSSMNLDKGTSSRSWLTSTLKNRLLPSLESTLQPPGLYFKILLLGKAEIKEWLNQFNFFLFV